ncbi:MAG: DUF3025 domain-containing protein [Polaromonas sp.]|uniref:DUF3025 domain-containing protein n=1 Tax=Polaromonas sp. TaxID=1869339 RepID=UPI00271FBF57|nr:DUF3025 domain-containing protein [Polaromonas sp.]MDO9113017.1 DUF3025 domain-containing protein [Polaromonas sp.]MDP1889025.1 DUF3025 domain-containing protein [Polaromonas sp.]MDP2450469.1 DUF3025 domain-containing protein [Polaromonas sp.]MDP3246450.1 DUF3025 domain-containing protein [Polaromonas sp.]MDP3756205.1 DUF3025 domain-containing protein [Polaromonas sp.]
MSADAPVAAWPVDWSRPWLSPWREPGERVALAIEGGATFHEALNREPGAPRRFVPQSALPPGQAYEQFIFETGTVPTRDNLHDFFNGLCWMRFPLTKKKLNQLQAAEIAAAGVAPLRGPVRDALTVFDENAAFLSAPPPLWDALAARDWQRLFVDLRPLWQQAQLVLFGHALLEKLVYPRKPITAHIYRAQPAMNSIADLDAWVAADLSADKLAAKPFVPLPVLGVPGWWPDNENFSFYDDSFVFRPRR